MSTIKVTQSLSKKRPDIFQNRELKSGDNNYDLQIDSESNIDNQSLFSVVGGEIPYISYAVICRSDGAVATIPHDVLGNLYLNAFKEKTALVFTKSIKNLLNTRNHLLLQLDLECGNISEEYFDKEEPKYLSEVEKIPPEKLKEEVNLLLRFTDLPFDSEDISEILNCPIDVFAKIIVGLAEKSPQIEPSALTTKGEILDSDTVFIATIAKTRTPRHRDLFQKTISNASHTHGATQWMKKQQANVKVVTPHQEIVNALNKRYNGNQSNAITQGI